VNGCFISGGMAGIDLNFDSDLAFTWEARASIAFFNTSPRPAAIKQDLRLEAVNRRRAIATGAELALAGGGR